MSGVGSLNLGDSLANDCLGDDNGGLAVVKALGFGDGTVDGSEVMACDNSGRNRICQVVEVNSDNEKEQNLQVEAHRQ